MDGNKLTKAVKQQITADWHRLLPSLGIYKPRWLLRRCGPLLQGVLLERDSTNDSYLPCFHVHNLARAFDSISLTLCSELLTSRTRDPDRIRVRDHVAAHEEACARLVKHLPLPLNGPIAIDEVLTAYQRELLTPCWQYSLEMRGDMVDYLIWCRKFDAAEKVIVRTLEEVSTWPSSVMESVGEVDAWHGEQLHRLQQPEIVTETVNVEVQKHGLAGLPTEQLLC